MINKRNNFKVFNVLTIFFLAAFLLSSCGGFSFQAQTAPAEDGGIAVTGGVDPILPGTDPAQPAPAGQMMTPATIILLLVGFGVLVLILLLLVRRPSTEASDKTPRNS